MLLGLQQTPQQRDPSSLPQGFPGWSVHPQSQSYLKKESKKD